MRKNCFLLWVALCVLTSCVSSVYKGGGEGEEPSAPEEQNEPLPDLSVSSSFDWEEVYVRIPIDGEADAVVGFPPLKYNKDFVYSYTFDDDVVQAYGKAFCTINRHWVDDKRCYHVGQTPTTGKTPAKTLGYTDGCGNERRFAFGVAIWPDMSNTNIDNFMAPTTHKADGYYPYLVWHDVVPLLDFGSDIYFHDVNTRGDDSVDGILMGMLQAQSITQYTLGRGMKILARPNGNNDYVTASRQFDDIVFVAVEGKTDIGSPLQDISFVEPQVLKNQAQFRRYTESAPSVGQLMPAINEKASSGEYVWLHDFSHAPQEFQYILDLFTELNDRYGKDGLDNIWFASLDEVYEYNYLRMNCVIEQTVSGGFLTLKFRLPNQDLPNEFMFHRDFSLVVSGISLKEDARMETGKNVYGYSYTSLEDGRVLLNMNCNASLLEKAERYTRKYEKSKAYDDREDALYFVNQLKEEYRKTFVDRLK